MTIQELLTFGGISLLVFYWAFREYHSELSKTKKLLDRSLKDQETLLSSYKEIRSEVSDLLQYIDTGQDLERVQQIKRRRRE